MREEGRYKSADKVRLSKGLLKQAQAQSRKPTVTGLWWFLSPEDGVEHSLSPGWEVRVAACLQVGAGGCHPPARRSLGPKNGATALGGGGGVREGCHKSGGHVVIASKAGCKTQPRVALGETISDVLAVAPGALTPADVEWLEGDVLSIDTAALTGEPLPRKYPSEET